MITRSFGKLSDGRSAGLYILRNKNGMEAHLTDYGAAIVRLLVPDQNGKKVDVVLGYDDAAAYEKGEVSFGATVGRYANRISNAAFDLGGRHYVLTANDGPNMLHGGRDPYNHRLWSTVIPFGKISTADISSAYALESMNDWSRERRGRETGIYNPVDAEEARRLAEHAASEGLAVSEQGSSSYVFQGDSAGKAPTGLADSITFALDSPDGDQGFPGDLHIEVTYTLTEENELHLDYHVTLNPGSISVEGSGEHKEVPLNLTNHSYFNLSGHDSGSVLEHFVRINAEWFTESDRRLIPTGELIDVSRTPMDFREPKKLSQDIEADYEPLRFGGGYDHNYVITKGERSYREVAEMYSEATGIRMTVLTDLPGMQLYTGNFLDDEPGKDGAVYGKRSAACFETQFWPDTINKENFPGGLIRAGEDFTSRTTYKFSVSEQV